MSLWPCHGTENWCLKEKGEIEIQMQLWIVYEDWRPPYKLSVVSGGRFRAKEPLEAKGKRGLCKLANAAAQKLNIPNPGRQPLQKQRLVVLSQFGQVMMHILKLRFLQKNGSNTNLGGDE